MDVFDVCDLSGRRSRIVFCDCDAMKVLDEDEAFGVCGGCCADLDSKAKEGASRAHRCERRVT